MLHGVKCTDPGFAGFGEAYFTTVQAGHVKGWKRHIRMTLNFVVAHGQVQVGVHDPDRGGLEYFLLGPESTETHARLTVPPGMWVAFGGSSPATSVMMNLASLPHDPTESEVQPIDFLAWEWLPT